ncbi:MAG: Uncharacterised protein [Opitutia bacterium UBA7350]|nr:MAG: Uncharacterised protein [Opitutae bacterium UBA7350]
MLQSFDAVSLFLIASRGEQVLSQILYLKP